MNAHVATGRLGELPQIAGTDDGDPAGWTPVRHLLGVKAFGVNAWHGDEGELVIEEHDEVPKPGSGTGGHEELYFVAAGRARFVIDGDELDAPAGTFVLLPPNLQRAAHAAESPTTVLVIGAPRGAPFAPSAWEERAIASAGLL